MQRTRVFISVKSSGTQTIPILNKEQIMKLERDDIKAAIREKVIALANELGEDASDISDEEIIPATGALDSAAILALVVWYGRRPTTSPSNRKR